MLLDIRDTPAGTGPDAPARAGPMMRFARAARTHWRALFLLTGAVLTLLGVVLASGAVLLPGVLLLLVALLHRTRSQRLHVRGPAGRVALARVRRRPALVPGTCAVGEDPRSWSRPCGTTDPAARRSVANLI